MALPSPSHPSCTSITAAIVLVCIFNLYVIRTFFNWVSPPNPPALFKVAGTVLKHANYSLLAVTTVMQYAHTYVSVVVRLPALRVINVRVHVRFHREAILPELPHP